VFAGLRSDPFCLAWFGKTMTPAPNLLQHDNVLCITIEFDTRRVLDLSKGTLFGVIAETVPFGAVNPITKLLPRIDWVGRPEQTNMRLYNAAMEGGDDLRDLWNQQTPFAIDDALRPAFWWPHACVGAGNKARGIGTRGQFNPLVVVIPFERPTTVKAT
jgi:hypothetical protein